MIYLVIILYLTYALFRRDWSLYEFDEPVIMYREPKANKQWVNKELFHWVLRNYC